MPGATITRRMPVPAAEVFALLHDYDRRLEWDTLLREARLTRGHERAVKGATSLCVSRPCLGIFGMETRYVTFTEGEVAAVKLINRPPLFEDFAATIRHEDDARGSSATYTFRFKARPRWLRRVLEPLMSRVLARETARRLDALAAFLGRRDSSGISPRPDVSAPAGA